MKKTKEYLINFINGFCMALADSVPGVSGGTIAFILGFYDKFIKSLDDLFRGNINKKKEALKYLIKLGIGWIVGLCVAVVFLSNLFNNHIYEMSSLFIGFIIFAIPIVIKEELNQIKGNYKNIIFSIIGILVVGIITYLNQFKGNSINIDTLNVGVIIYVFLASMIAFSAMILPGISGSTILLVFGLYIPIVSKIKSFLSFDFRTLPVLIIFGLGVLCGLLYFTKILRKLLDKKRSVVIYVVLGMMIASIYSIIMGPTTLDIPLKHVTLKTFNIFYFILGGLIIFCLESLKSFLTKGKY